jgi:hypothetical protein
MRLCMRRLTCVCFLLAALTTCAAAQTNTRARRAQPPARADVPEAQAQANVNEDFELNITERHIVEHDFFASTSVALGDGEAPLVRIGVALGAQELDVLLRNVRGRVRFRASLEQIRRVLDARRAPAPPAAPPPVP